MKCCDIKNPDTLKQILLDSGLTKLQSDEYEKLSNDCEKILFLKKHRISLLEEIRADQKKIDCLDYLIMCLKDECCK